MTTTPVARRNTAGAKSADARTQLRKVYAGQIVEIREVDRQFWPVGFSDLASPTSFHPEVLRSDARANPPYAPPEMIARRYFLEREKSECAKSDCAGNLDANDTLAVLKLGLNRITTGIEYGYGHWLEFISASGPKGRIDENAGFGETRADLERVHRLRY